MVYTKCSVTRMMKDIETTFLIYSCLYSRYLILDTVLNILLTLSNLILTTNPNWPGKELFPLHMSLQMLSHLIFTTTHEVSTIFISISIDKISRGGTREV
jgi:hypothetical protein